MQLKIDVQGVTHYNTIMHPSQVFIKPENKSTQTKEKREDR